MANSSESENKFEQGWRRPADSDPPLFAPLERLSQANKIFF